MSFKPCMDLSNSAYSNKLYSILIYLYDLGVVDEAVFNIITTQSNGHDLRLYFDVKMLFSIFPFQYHV